MVAPSLFVGVLWLLTTSLLWGTMVTDDEWAASEDTRLRALADSALLGLPTIVLPALLVAGVDVVTPTTTPRGRTLAGWTAELVAVVLAGVGLYLGYISRRRGFLDGDAASVSVRGQQRLWLIAGVAMAVSALGTGFL